MKSTPASRIKPGMTIIFTGPTSTPGKFITRHYVTGATHHGDSVTFETNPDCGTNDGFGFYRLTTAKSSRLTIEQAAKEVTTN